MKMHYWVRADPSDFGGTLPRPRSGHSAVNIGKSKIVVFGGLVDKKFLNHIAVYDIGVILTQILVSLDLENKDDGGAMSDSLGTGCENKLWFQPDCTGSDSEGQVGPCARAFHVSVSIDCHMFIFGGRSGNKRLGDFWVLDTDIWQWSELTSFGDLPSPRDFAAASAIGNRKIVMYGGWDGKKWLSDVYVLDTISLEWTELSVSGSLPPPRCGHTATMVEKRLLVYGGRGGGGPIMADLWALKGLIDEENETPGWTQLKLPGQAPSARCGHTVTSGGHYLLLFGGHGTGGWLSRYDVYYNDCIVLDRVTVQWRRLPTKNELPAARAYHSMTCIGSRYLLYGGFDGKSTYDDFWWLVPEEDPIAKRSIPIPPEVASEKKDSVSAKESQSDGYAVAELQKRLGISLSNHKQILDESEDKDFIDLGKQLAAEGNFTIAQDIMQELRDHWSKCLPRAIPFKELSSLLRDYQRLVTRNHMKKAGSDATSADSGFSVEKSFRFYHMKNASQLRLDDIPQLLAEYNQLVLDK